MKGFRRFLGALLYLFMAFPLLLGGLSLAAVRPVAGGPDSVKTLVSDARFSALLASPGLAELAPESIELGGQALDGKAALRAFQAAVPASTLVSTIEGGIDSAFAAIRRGEAFFYVDARPLKKALDTGARDFADSYIRVAGGSKQIVPAGKTRTRPESAVQVLVPPDSAAGRAVIAELVRQAAAAQPDEWALGEAGSRFEQPIRLGALGSGLSGASAWLIITGAGLCFASVRVAETDWRRRLGTLGSRLLVPSVMVLVIGLVPYLFTSGKLVPLPASAQAPAFAELTEYLRFLAARISGGFLTAGLIGTGLGTAFVSARRAIPQAEDEATD